MDGRMFHGAKVSSRILSYGSAVIAWLMDAGNAIVQTGKIARLQVNMALVVNDV